MQEERTASRFTRTDTRGRANQDARTIVAQAKIYQHIEREYRAADKSPKSSKSPSLNWRSVKTLIPSIPVPIVSVEPAPVIDLTVGDEGGTVPSEATPAGPHLSITSECEAGLQTLNAVDDDDDQPDIAAGSLVDTILSQYRDGVDIRLPVFRDLLSDTPVVDADKIRSIAEWSESSVVGAESRGEAAGKKVWDGEAD
ncbi:hypothetical protein B0H13DRAFT_2332314 [Mycena leptocephala]|nr:hypothetical protein B0H13DRAFT_2332314 [Mycena leptocephala]